MKLSSISEWLKTDEGQQSIKDFVKELELEDTRKEINISRLKRFYSNQEEFDSLMEKIESKHTEAWKDSCYKKSIMPYPWEILCTAHNIAENEGVELVEGLDPFTNDFSSTLYEYMGWQFAITNGQGSVLSVYKNKQLKFRI